MIVIEVLQKCIEQKKIQGINLYIIMMPEELLVLKSNKFIYSLSSTVLNSFRLLLIFFNSTGDLSLGNWPFKGSWIQPNY